MADADVLVVGAGLAGLVAACEVIDKGKTVILADQEPEASLGGQAFWSLGGLFLVNTPEQRRLGIHDSRDLAWQDWLSTAGFDRPEDGWPRRWAEAYVDFASGEERAWLRSLGLRFFPVVGWAERRAMRSDTGNSVPRFHITWGTGPAVMAPFANRVRHAATLGKVRLAFRHRIDELVLTAGRVSGVRGTVLAEDGSPRGHATSRYRRGEFEFSAESVVVSSGGIGGDLGSVRAAWQHPLGPVPTDMLTGVPAHVDGRMLDICRKRGATVINSDRMWHYTEGVQNWDPIWPNHGIRILPGPSSFWLDAHGNRLPSPLYPGFDTLGALRHICSTSFNHSWFVLNESIIRREFALSGSEQNPDLTEKSIRLLARRMLSRHAPAPVEAFKNRGVDFVVADRLGDLVDGMNRVTGEPLVSENALRAIIAERDSDPASSKDDQMREIVRARHYWTERLTRVAKPSATLDPANGPLIAVRLRVLTRKTLGGLQTDLSARVLDVYGSPISGLYAAGEVAGFGGGGMHGYRALEGSFLGGCLFSGRVAGREASG